MSLDIATVTQEVSSQLAALWSTAALPIAERDELLVALGNELRQVLERSVAIEKARQAALTAELPALHAELVVLRSRLADQSTLVGIGADDSASDARPLISRHRALAAYVMAGRGTVASRLAERQEKEARISAIRLELDGPESVSALEGVGNEPFVGSAGGLALSLLGQLQAKLDELCAERESRVSRAKELHTKADKLRAELGYERCTADVEAGVSTAQIAMAEKVLGELASEKSRRLTVLADCADYISELNTKLNVPLDERPVLPSPEVGLSQAVLETYHGELERLEQLKTASLGPLLRESRARLRPLWEQLHMSFEETKQFAEGWACVGADGEEEDPSTIENLEEVLWAVEEEEKRLQAKLESAGRIFGLMAKREALLAQKAEMADPTRVVSSRGGALLREEKLRVAIEKDLPKMNRKLKELAGEWAEAHGGEALGYGGFGLNSVIEAQEAADAKAKVEEKARKEAKKLASGAVITPRHSVHTAGSARGPKYAARPSAGSKRDVQPAPPKEAPPAPPPALKGPATPVTPAVVPTHVEPSDKVLALLEGNAAAAPANHRAKKPRQESGAAAAENGVENIM